MLLRALASACLLLIPGIAAAQSCAVPAPGPSHTRIRTAADLARLDPAVPVLAWIGATRDEALELPRPDPALLRRLTLRPGSVLSRLDLGGADLSGWRVPGVMFDDTSLSGADLKGADLSKSCFFGGSLEGADLSGAELGGLLVDQAETQKARFARARLAGATLQCFLSVVGSGCPVDDRTAPLDFTGADLRGADIAGPVEAYGAVLSGAAVDGTGLAVDADLFKWLAGARLGSVRLRPPAFRTGEGELFSAADLETVRRAAPNGDPTALLRNLATTPAFDCNARLTPIETAICKDGGLAALDRAMADAWRQRAAAGGDRAIQQGFLRTRNACKADDAGCLRDAYLDRLAALGRELPPVFAETAPKQPLLFVDDPYVLTGAAAASPAAALGPRLLAAWGQSANTAALTPDGDSIAIEAGSVGANTHACDFSGTLRRQPDGRWRDPDEADTMSWILLPNAVVMASDWDEARSFCGMRAGWPAVYFRRP